MKTTKKIFVLLLCSILCIMLTSCDYQLIPRELFNAKMFVKDFGDAATALTFLSEGKLSEDEALKICNDVFHPRSDLDANSFFEYINQIYSERYTDFNSEAFNWKDIKFTSFRLWRFMTYDMEIQGYTYKFEIQLNVQNIEHDIVVLVLSDEFGMGIYRLEC